MKRSKKLSLIIAPLLVLALAGTAIAVTTFQPTVSLQASTNRTGGHKIVASGTYDEVSSICHGPGGRTVTIYVNGKAKGTTTTKARGNYKFGAFGPFKNGSYEVQTFVPGSVRSGYGNTHICFNAWSTVRTVNIGRNN